MLVDCSGGRIEGWAYEVMSEEQEDALRVYETSRYEVIRVEIRMENGGQGRVVRGCSFRFVGEEAELD